MVIDIFKYVFEMHDFYSCLKLCELRSICLLGDVFNKIHFSRKIHRLTDFSTVTISERRNTNNRSRVLTINRGEKLHSRRVRGCMRSSEEEWFCVCGVVWEGDGGGVVSVQSSGDESHLGNYSVRGKGSNIYT